MCVLSQGRLTLLSVMEIVWLAPLGQITRKSALQQVSPPAEEKGGGHFQAGEWDSFSFPPKRVGPLCVVMVVADQGRGRKGITQAGLGPP